MNRRSILRLLGLAPVAAPIAVAAAARAVTEAVPLSRTYGVGGVIEAQATAICSLTTRIPDGSATVGALQSQPIQTVARRTTALEALVTRVTCSEGNIASLTSGLNTLAA